MKLAVKVATIEALDAVKARPNRVCPLICEHGFKADGERCTKILCQPGYELGDDNNCERLAVKKKPTTPVAKQDQPGGGASPSVANAPKPASTERRYGTDHAGSYLKCTEISMRAGWSGADASRYCGRRYAQ